MIVKRYVMGMFSTNSYVIEDKENVVLIDPACKPEKMIELLKDKKLSAILLTHGHLDHIKAVDGLVKHYGCKVYLHEKDIALSQNKDQGRVFGIVNSPVIKNEVITYEEGKLLIFPFEFEIIFTPGHTKGSVLIRIENHLFTGDTLFHLSVGRTDLQGGDESELKASLRVIKSMQDELIIHPGHDEESTLFIEKQYNPFLN